MWAARVISIGTQEDPVPFRIRNLVRYRSFSHLAVGPDISLALQHDLDIFHCLLAFAHISGIRVVDVDTRSMLAH